MKSLITATLSGNELEHLVDYADDSAGKQNSEPFAGKFAVIDVAGSLDTDLTKAKPQYKLGALQYGPIEASVHIDHLDVVIDWHNALGIPHAVCLTLKDPCGHVIYDECVSFDLGVTTLHLYSGPILATDFSARILDVDFVQGNADYFDLKGKLSFVAMLYDILVAGIAKAATRHVGEFVEELLKKVFGHGDIANLLINVIKSVFRIIDKAMDFVADTVKAGLQPLDEALHAIFGNDLEIMLKREALPRKLVVMAETKSPPRPAVTVVLANPPNVDLLADGLHVEMWA